MVQETTVVNVYKPPPSRLEQGSLPDSPAPAVYAGDFNCWHTDWGYKSSTQDGEFLAEWFSSADAVLLFDPKEPSSFISGRWNTETNPDLAFAKVIGHKPLPVRRILDRFPRSQHRPSLITTPSLVLSTEGKPVRRWNFRKANWTDFERAVNTVVEALPVPTASNINDAYEAYCKMLTDAAKKHVPRGVRKNYVPCWDKVCEELLCAHNEATGNAERATAATDLVTRLNTKRRERWTETVESIDFTHSSRRAWQTINKLTGQATKPKPCPITADAIAAQLISNGRFPDADKPFTRKTIGEVHDLRRAPSADLNLSGDFTNDEMVSAIKHLKPNKAPGIDNIHPEFILHQGSKATEYLYPKPQNPEDMATRQGHRSPKTEQTSGRPKGIPTHRSSLCAVQDHGTAPACTPRPGDRPDIAEGASRFPPREVNSRPGDPPHSGHRGQFSDGGEGRRRSARPNRRLRHRLAPWTPPQAPADNIGPPHGELHHGDAEQP